MTPIAARQAGPSVAVSPSPAVLVLDAHGRVELANPEARTLWQAGPNELIGEFFPNLFAFEVTSAEKNWIETQWEVLLAAALARPANLKIQPKEAGSFEAVVRLEQCSADPVRYFAFCTAVPRPVTPAASATGNESIFGILADGSALGFFDLNFVRKETYYSPAWKRMLGYGENDLPSTYDSWLAIIHPDDSAAAPDKLSGRSPTVGARPFSVEYRLRHARGHYLWMQGVGVQIHGPNGALQRVVGVNLDIHDRKEFDESALRAEERLNLIAEHGRLAFFDLDFTGHRSWLSPAFKGLLGYASSELPDAPDSVLHALPVGETAGGLAAYFLTPQPGQTFFFTTIRLRHRSGGELCLYAGIVRLISPKRELHRVLGFVAPLPENSVDGAGLPTEHLSVLLAELREGALLADARGRVIFVNPVAERLLGRPADRIVDQPCSEVFRLVHRLSNAPGENPVDRAIALGEISPLNNEFALDGSPLSPPLPVTYSCRPVIGPDGRTAGAVLVFRNPGEMSLTPEELIRSNRFEALGQLAGGIAHDFNNLLTTILGGISLAKDNREYTGLDNSERACLAAKALSKQLLAFAKGGATVRQVIKPGELLADAVRISSAGSAVKVELTVPADLGVVCADRAQLLQVFQNLLINAIQAMPAGQGNIWVTAGNLTLVDDQIAPLPAGHYVGIEVRDNGSGIKPELLAKIFDPFFTTKQGGTGLGLATVLSIVKRHGGQLGVDSELDVGTTFTVFLPRTAEEIEVEARRAPSLRFGTGRVLFMDDDPNISYLTGTMLESLGYKFDLAKTGDEAIQFYKRYLNVGRPYDLVIMDLTIVGGMGGEEAFKHLRELDPGVRAIIASGYDDDDMARQLLDLGFCGYLTKPYRVGDLGRVIKKVLGN